MGKQSDTTWKHDHPSTLLGNAVQRANRAVKQAMSHPAEHLVEQAQNSMVHAEQALNNALEFNEHMDTVEQNQTQLDLLRDQLEQVQQPAEDQFF